MEIWEVLGVDTNYVVLIKAENKQIAGVKLFLVGDAPDQSGRFLGRVCRDQFISNERRQKLNVEPMPGDTIELFFDRAGNIAKIEIMK